MKAHQHCEVVDINSSDEEDTVCALTTNLPLLSPSIQVEKDHHHSHLSSSINDNQNPDWRSFWKAGEYNVTLSKSATSFQGHLEHARVHPKFLHSNATSHKWAFGAIAELLDNAVDEISNGATFVKVDTLSNMKDNSPTLLFQDDGGGMDPESMRKCMSLGYSSKISNTTIGQYGNGFKTSTMRLGADVIVLSRAARPGRSTQSVGLLSYTFLRTTGQDDVVVPMLDFDTSGHWADPIIYNSQDDWSSDLKTILEWSPFVSKEDLMLQFDDIGQHGTKIIIYNLWLNDEGIYELNFNDDDEDIQLRDEANRGGVLQKVRKNVAALHSHISYRMRYSLRAYASILYLRKLPNFHIILRGKLVQQLNLGDELKHSTVVVYRPQLATTSKEVIVETKLGFIKEAPAVAVSGFNVYHKNRLIRPFWKVTVEGNSQGNGVVGVLEANFIKPAHDKQDFERSSLFIRLENKLKQVLLEYWRANCHLIGLQPPGAQIRNLRKEYPVQTSANLGHDMNKSHPRNGYGFDNESSGTQRIVGLSTGLSREALSPNDSRPTSIDQICKENLELFMRCEKHMQKRNELKLTAEKLEKELDEAKKKYAQLASLIKLRKQQNGMV